MGAHPCAMRVIDAHVHLYPPDVNRDPAGWAASAGEANWATLCTRRRKDGRPVQGFPSVDELLAEMDRAGVERAVLMGWYWETAPAGTLQNTFFAECVRAHPDRLSACATIQPRAGAAVVRAEMHRARELGLVGLGELSPHSQGYAWNDAAVGEALALAGEWRWPVNLHVTDPDSRAYPGRVETPLADFVALARAHSQVNFILAHWGGLLPLRDPKAARLDNLFYDTAASPLLYDASVWSRFGAVVTAERVLFGSDFPLNLYPRSDATPMMTRWLAEAKRAGASETVFSANAERLFGLAGAR